MEEFVFGLIGGLMGGFAGVTLAVGVVPKVRERLWTQPEPAPAEPPPGIARYQQYKDKKQTGTANYQDFKDRR